MIKVQEWILLEPQKKFLTTTCPIEFFVLVGQDRNIKVLKTIIQCNKHAVLQLKDYLEDNP